MPCLVQDEETKTNFCPQPTIPEPKTEGEISKCATLDTKTIIKVETNQLQDKTEKIVQNEHQSEEIPKPEPPESKATELASQVLEDSDTHKINEAHSNNNFENSIKESVSKSKESKKEDLLQVTKTAEQLVLEVIQNVTYQLSVEQLKFIEQLKSVEDNKADNTTFTPMQENVPHLDPEQDTSENALAESRTENVSQSATDVHIEELLAADASPIAHEEGKRDSTMLEEPGLPNNRIEAQESLDSVIAKARRSVNTLKFKLSQL
ncbi:hypothetical protein EB796_016268 [Bugula neritina]|uniref:Uncharacterized protein n=1 Tax=Bugula neritina TaxID=10212 RepID=A0A7J7JJ76_BUGNE|nr:hypothetical protein EB796_016268 [Bugula neritina]